MVDINNMMPHQFASKELCEEIRTYLKEALDKCNLPYEYTKDRLLAEFTREVLLAKM